MSVEQEAKSMGFYTRIMDDGHGRASLVLGRAKEAVEGLANPGNHKGKVGHHTGWGEISEGTAVEAVAALSMQLPHIVHCLSTTQRITFPDTICD